MEVEIERKWLVADEVPPVDLTQLTPRKIRQAYFSPDARVRIEQDGDQLEDMRAVICVKRRMSILTVHEFNFDVDRQDAIELMKTMDVIEKYRYDIGNGFTLDVFKRDLEGIMLIEKEYQSEEQAAEDVVPEHWTVIDVTGQPQFINANMADKKFDRVNGLTPRLDSDELVLLEGNEEDYDIQ